MLFYEGYALLLTDIVNTNIWQRKHGTYLRLGHSEVDTSVEIRPITSILYDCAAFHKREILLATSCEGAFGLPNFTETHRLPKFSLRLTPAAISHCLKFRIKSCSRIRMQIITAYPKHSLATSFGRGWTSSRVGRLGPGNVQGEAVIGARIAPFPK